MYDADIQTKISILPESAKQEVLDFIEFLLTKYSSFSKKRTRKDKNPMSEIAGFAEIGKMDSAEIDNEIKPYHKVRHLIGTVESGISDLGQNHRKYCRVEDVFKDIRGKVKYYDDIIKLETEEWEDLNPVK